MIKFVSLFTAGLFGAVSALPVQSPVPGKPVTATASPSPSPAAAPLAADDLDALRAHLNQVVDVRGTPTGTGRSKAGTVVYLNFGKAHGAISAVAFLSTTAGSDPAAHKVQSEDDLKPFVGKAVVLHGKLADYKGDVQIVLDSLDQITVAP